MDDQNKRRAYHMKERDIRHGGAPGWDVYYGTGFIGTVDYVNPDACLLIGDHMGNDETRLNSDCFTWHVDYNVAPGAYLFVDSTARLFEALTTINREGPFDTYDEARAFIATECGFEKMSWVFGAAEGFYVVPGESHRGECEGCDGDRVSTGAYVAQFGTADYIEGAPELVRYCDDCARLAARNYNGSTRWIVRVTGGAR